MEVYYASYNTPPANKIQYTSDKNIPLYFSKASHIFPSVLYRHVYKSYMILLFQEYLLA